MATERSTIYNFDPNKLAKDLGLTEKQQKFADAYVFVCGLDSEKAVEITDYKLDAVKEFEAKNKTGSRDGDYYYKLTVRKLARDLITSPKVLEYIQQVRDNLDKQLIVDKFWVIDKLKKLSETGAERTQLEATKLIGQTMNMFQPDMQTVIYGDPAEIAKEAFKKRMQQEKQSNVVPFKKEVGD